MSDKLVIRVYFVDDSFKTLAISSKITAAELVSHVAEKVNLTQKKHFQYST